MDDRANRPTVGIFEFANRRLEQSRLGRLSPPASPWEERPIREELFGVERLEEHARSLAAAQAVSSDARHKDELARSLAQNDIALRRAYQDVAAAIEAGAAITPAAEWLIDNFHVVEEQIDDIRLDLPPGYRRQLPKLASGPFAGYPRVFGLAWAFVAHTDSHFDPQMLGRFIRAYQRVQPLTIGELWAVAITLRIVLIENLRRLADQIMAGREARADAGSLAGRLLAPGRAQSALESDILTRVPGPLSERFAAELAKRLRDQDPQTMPALDWLEERLRLQGSSVDDVVQHTQQRQGASNVTVRNIITSMRLISDVDWMELVENVSLVDEHLRAARAEALHGGRAILLRAIRVDGLGAQPVARELARQPIAANLRVDEDDRRLVRAAQVLREEARLLARGQYMRFVRDGLRRTAARSDLDEDGIRRERVGEPHHLIGHRRREKHRLA